jgi:metal-responsive CopG/Arc/MetJ family transcriptional regulator
MKVTKTYSIDESLFEIFDSLTTEKNINKSSFIEDVIKKYIKDNDMDTINKQYISKSDPNHIVTVLQQDQTYYILDDGSKIQKILFLHLFKPYTGVDTEEFFSKTNYVFEDIVEHIKRIDTKNIVEYSNDTIKSKITDYRTLYEKPLTGENINIKKHEKSENNNEIDPNIFFGKSNSVISDIVDQFRQNINHDMVDMINELNEDTTNDDTTNELNEDIAILNYYYNNYKVGGFITKTKDELSDIMINLKNLNFSYTDVCTDYFHNKIKLLNIVKVYSDAL